MLVLRPRAPDLFTTDPRAPVHPTVVVTPKGRKLPAHVEAQITASMAISMARLTEHARKINTHTCSNKCICGQWARVTAPSPASTSRSPQKPKVAATGDGTREVPLTLVESLQEAGDADDGTRSTLVQPEVPASTIESSSPFGSQAAASSSPSARESMKLHGESP
jgi:hypothetical protein